MILWTELDSPARKKKKHSGISPLPRNAVCVLNEMRPGMEYKLVSQNGPVHCPIFTMSVKVSLLWHFYWNISKIIKQSGLFRIFSFGCAVLAFTWTKNPMTRGVLIIGLHGKGLLPDTKVWMDRSRRLTLEIIDISLIENTNLKL